MRISELARRSGTAVSTLKYYLREGLLAPGEARGATQAAYSEEHLHRIRLIRALSDVAGLPIQRIKAVLGIIDEPGGNLYAALGRAVEALPPYADAQQAVPSDFPLARQALEAVGQVYDPGFAAVGQLERALQAVADAGMPISGDRLQVYARSLRSMAEIDVGKMPLGSPSAAVEYAVLGTALYEPVILALRRLAHQDIAARMADGGAAGDAG